MQKVKFELDIGEQWEFWRMAFQAEGDRVQGLIQFLRHRHKKLVNSVPKSTQCSNFYNTPFFFVLNKEFFALGMGLLSVGYSPSIVKAHR